MRSFSTFLKGSPGKSGIMLEKLGIRKETRWSMAYGEAQSKEKRNIFSLQGQCESEKEFGRLQGGETVFMKGAKSLKQI